MRALHAFLKGHLHIVTQKLPWLRPSSRSPAGQQKHVLAADRLVLPGKLSVTSRHQKAISKPVRSWGWGTGLLHALG